jgi:hypothetical protein
VLIDKKGRPLILDESDGTVRVRLMTAEDLIKMGREGFETGLSIKYIPLEGGDTD